MSGPPDDVGPSPRQLTRYIETSGENDNIDAKAAMKWDCAAQSAALAKDIVAFANSRDGGVIVIGKSEVAKGKFDYNGLTSDQADSFETTRVAAWVNSRFSPPVHFACYRHEYKGNTFVVIAIREFTDIPAFCTKSFSDPGNPKRFLLREGTIYVRNQNAESKPLGTVEEWRALIGLATKKRSDEFLGIINAMLKGKPAVEESSADELFESDLARVWADLNLNKPEVEEQAAWWMSFHPSAHNPDRWTEAEGLEETIRTHSVRLYEHFPGYQRGIFSMGWGIANDFYGDTWALTRSGLFAFYNPFRENSETCETPGYRGGEEARTPLPAGQWVAYQWSMATLIPFFAFMARFGDAYEPGESITWQIAAGPLQGRRLASVNDRVVVSHGIPDPCRAREYRSKRTIPVEEFRSSWEEHCAQAMKEFFQLFPECRVSVETLRKWIESYKERRFWG